MENAKIEKLAAGLPQHGARAFLGFGRTRAHRKH